MPQRALPIDWQRACHGQRPHPGGQPALRCPERLSCRQLGGQDSTTSSGSFQVDPFDSVNHFLECKIVKGKSYSCPVLLIARINRHN